MSSCRKFSEKLESFIKKLDLEWLNLDDTTSWYNGYTLGIKYAPDLIFAYCCTKIYNPWSILQYIDNGGSAETYWANTGSTELLEELIKRASSSVQEELISLLQENS